MQRYQARKYAHLLDDIEAHAGWAESAAFPLAEPQEALRVFEAGELARELGGGHRGFNGSTNPSPCRSSLISERMSLTSSSARLNRPS